MLVKLSFSGLGRHNQCIFKVCALFGLDFLELGGAESKHFYARIGLGFEDFGPPGQSRTRVRGFGSWQPRIGLGPKSSNPNFRSLNPSFQSPNPNFQSPNPSFQSSNPSFQSPNPGFQSSWQICLPSGPPGYRI